MSDPFGYNGSIIEHGIQQKQTIRLTKKHERLILQRVYDANNSDYSDQIIVHAEEDMHVLLCEIQALREIIGDLTRLKSPITKKSIKGAWVGGNRSITRAGKNKGKSK